MHATRKLHFIGLHHTSRLILLAPVLNLIQPQAELLMATHRALCHACARCLDLPAGTFHSQLLDALIDELVGEEPTGELVSEWPTNCI